MARIRLALAATPRRYHDSASYLHLSFFAHAPRLWLVPSLYDALPNDVCRVLAQTIIAAGCWLFLAREMYVLGGRRTGSLVAGLTLVLGLSAAVTQWDGLILSESLAISSTCLVLALLLRVIRSPTPLSALWLVLGIGCWAFCRQAQALAAIAVAVCMAAVAFRARRRVPLLAAAGSVAIVALAVPSALATSARPLLSGDGISHINADGLIALRILPSKERTTWFVHQGLPVTSAEERAAGDQTRVYSLFLRDARLNSWIEHRWATVYSDFLFTHPAFTFVEPIEAAPGLMTETPAYGRPIRLLGPVDSWATGTISFAFALCLLGGMGLLGVVRRMWRPVAGIAGATMVLMWWLLLTWHFSGGLELPRLVDPIGIATRLVALAVAAGVHQLSAHDAVATYVRLPVTEGRQVAVAVPG